MWIAVCNGDPVYRGKLTRQVQSIAKPYGDKVTAYASGVELLRSMYSSKIPHDLLLLDIELPAISGFETALEARQVNPDLQIVIVTAHDDQAFDAYKIRPSNYLLSPVPIKTLQEELNRARRIAWMNVGEMLCINLRSSVEFVPYKDILFIECRNNTLFVCTAAANHEYTEQLSHISKKLVEHGFTCAHRSLMVNLHHVTRIDKKRREATLFTGQTVVISERRISPIIEEYTKLYQTRYRSGAFTDERNGAPTPHKLGVSIILE